MTKDDDNNDGKRPHGRGGRSDRPGRPNRDTRPRRDDGGRDKPRKFAPRDAEAQEDTGERIAKRLARAGIASRREAETMIAAGRIAVNGKVLESPAVNVKRTDIITVDGKPLKQTERTRLWLYHKPAGLVTTNRDPEGRPTVFEALPAEMPRVLSVGRLDINTEGLLLLTNDGGLSRVLELPSTGWLRRYRVRAHGKVTQVQLDELKNGIAVDGVFYGSIEATLEREQGANVWISIGLREGKNREVKNILGALGLTVGRLIRVSFGPFQLGDLEEGAVREIKGRILRDQLGDKLIEDSGADFDAPVLNEFSNAAVQGRTRRDVEDEGEEGERRRGPREREWISSSPQRRRGRDDKGAERLNRVVAETPMSGWLQVRVPRAKMRLPSPPVSNVKFRIVQRNSVAICRCVRVGLVMRSRDATKVVNAAITSDRKAALIRTLVHSVRVRMEAVRKRDVQSAVSSVRMDARSVVPANASVQNCATRKAGL